MLAGLFMSVLDFFMVNVAIPSIQTDLRAKASGTGGSLAALVPGLVVDGAGMKFALAPLVGTVLARVRPEHAGAASGILSTSVQVGNALGVSLVGLLFFGALAQGGDAGAGLYAHAYTVSLVFLIAVVLTAALLVQLLPREVR